MADIDIKFEQNKANELIAKLDGLTEKIQNKAIGSALRFGATPILKDARGRIRDKTGGLSRSLGTVLRKFPSGNRALVIGARTSGKFVGFHSHLVEFGTKPHLIRPKVAKFLRFLGRFLPTVMHPGSRPRPFLRPAFEANKGRAAKRIGEKLGRIIEKLAREK